MSSVLVNFMSVVCQISIFPKAQDNSLRDLGAMSYLVTCFQLKIWIHLWHQQFLCHIWKHASENHIKNSKVDACKITDFSGKNITKGKLFEIQTRKDKIIVEVEHKIRDRRSSFTKSIFQTDIHRILSKPNVNISILMLRAYLSYWNYMIIWKVFGKFISLINTVGYRVCYKFVIKHTT